MLFTKMQSCGNDFVFFCSPKTEHSISSDQIRILCDRHYGIGADCAVSISNSRNADYAMRVFNPDGFEAEMCGNALRCSAKFVNDSFITEKNELVAETNSGLRSVKNDNGIVTAEIGKPRVLKECSLGIDGIEYKLHLVDVGNPHCVVHSNHLNNKNFEYIGKVISESDFFVNGCNVEFITITNENEAAIRIWERGIGETLSCVTGSCAVAAVLRGKYDNYLIKQPGGTVRVERRSCGNMFVSGKCETVFTGEINI